MADERVIFTDSCAIPDHPMVNHIWRERLGVADALIASQPRQSLVFTAGAVMEKLRRSLRATAKAAFYKLSGRKAS